MGGGALNCCLRWPLAGRKLTQVGDQAFTTFGFASGADITAMQDQPVVGIAQELLRYQPQQPLFHFQYILARGNAGTVGDPEDMRVYGHGG